MQGGQAGAGVEKETDMSDKVKTCIVCDAEHDPSKRLSKWASQFCSSCESAFLRTDIPDAMVWAVREVKLRWAAKAADMVKFAVDKALRNQAAK
jgi:hypothetical protein